KRRWDEMNISLGRIDVTKFMRHYWLSNYGIVREKDLYRTISREIRASMDVFGFVKKLQDSAELYGAFEDPLDPVWSLFDSSVKEDIAKLSLFKVSQCYPVLLAAKEHLSDQLFAKILRMMVLLSFRYSVICNSSANVLESAFSDTARFIRKDKP